MAACTWLPSSTRDHPGEVVLELSPYFSLRFFLHLLIELYGTLPRSLHSVTRLRCGSVWSLNLIRITGGPFSHFRLKKGPSSQPAVGPAMSTLATPRATVPVWGSWAKVAAWADLISMIERNYRQKAKSYFPRALIYRTQSHLVFLATY